jgi:hypothetical protein
MPGEYSCIPFTPCTKNTAPNANQNGRLENSGLSPRPGCGDSISDAYTSASGNGSRSFSAHWRRTITAMHITAVPSAARKMLHVSSGISHARHGTPSPPGERVMKSTTTGSDGQVVRSLDANVGKIQLGRPSASIVCR